MSPSEHVRKYDSRNPFRRACIRNFQNSVRRLISGLDVQTALFVGCGEGMMLSRLELPALGFVHGLDIDAGSIVIARGKEPGVNFAVGDVHHLPYPARSLDLVVCLEVLEHLCEPARAVHEIITVARRYVLVSVPHEPFFRLGNLLFMRNPRRFGSHPGHIHHWSRSGLQWFFEDLSLFGTMSAPFPWLLWFYDIEANRR